MPKIAYQSKNFSASSLAMIDQANQIIAEFSAQGFDLTLRQIYYQFVSRDLLANKQTEYKRLGSVVNDGRLAGLIDWEAIVDRTRNVRDLPHWDDPSDIVSASAKQFRIDKWATQATRINVWIEKDALVGVIDGVCRKLDVPYFSCRGYTSQSEMWSAARRFLMYSDAGQKIVVIHLGDHDPSGIDMSRDIEDRIRMFMGEYESRFSFVRIALNMDQVRKYNPPPNPAKLTDSRSSGYVTLHGSESWELDALSPKVLAKLIETEVAKHRDNERWEQSVAEEKEGRNKLERVADQWENILGEIGE